MIGSMTLSADQRAAFDALPAHTSLTVALTRRDSEIVLGLLVLHELDNDLAGPDGSADEAASLAGRLVTKLVP